MNHSSTSSLPPILSPNGSPTIISDTIVQDFAVIMIVAAIMVLLTYKLKQPMVLGYILAGMIIGPYTPPFPLLQDIETINIFAELGIIMLLFVIGTDFPIHKLRSVGRISIIVALAELVGTLFFTLLVSQQLGLSFYDSIFIALAMSITSTVITVRVLEELNMISDTTSTLILGISIVEDISAISALAVIQSMAAGDGGGSAEFPITQLLVSIGIVVAFIGSILILGSRFVPNLIDKLGKTNDYSLLLIAILGLAVGLSVAANLLGLSVATGALMNISLIPAFLITALLLTLTSFSSKFVIVAALLNRAKYDNITSMRTALGMASAKGELSLVVAKAGQDVG